MRYISIPYLIRKVPKPVHWECDGGTEFEMSDGDEDR